MGSSAPVGVFDSGVGGLTVLREIRRLLPSEPLLYVADSAHAPYGDKPEQAVRERVFRIADHLIAEGAKALVVACNTATAVAVPALRERIPLPVIAMEPAIKPAVEQTRSGVVGVLATNGTLSSQRFLHLLDRFGRQVEVLVQPCPGLVEQIEAGDGESPATQALLTKYVSPLIKRGADVLVLGCTHYPLLRSAIRDLVGPEVLITDSGLAVARQLQRRLEETQLLAPGPGPGVMRFWSSAEPIEQQSFLISAFWGEPAEVERFDQASD